MYNEKPFAFEVSDSIKKDVEQLYEELIEKGSLTSGINPKNSPNQKPQWLDENRMVRTQQLARKYFASLTTCHYAGLLLLFQMPTLLEPVLYTRTHNTMANLFTRYVATMVHLRNWYESNPFDLKSDACKSFKKINLMHRRISGLVNNEANNNLPHFDPKKVYFNQYDMALTQWTSIAPVVLYPKQFGFHSITKAEIEDFIYYWRVIGYCLGMDDKYNACLETYEETHYFCKLLLDRDVYPVCARIVPELCEYPPLGMAEGFTVAMKPLTPLISLQGLMRYLYKVMRIPVYVEVENRFGYWLVVFILRTVFRVSLFHWVFSYILKSVLVVQHYRTKTIAAYYETKYADIDFLADYCPFQTKPVEYRMKDRVGE